MVELKNISLPDNFFEAENRNDFLIDRKKKEVWAVQLDILDFLKKICEKYDIEWFIYAGSLLGCVRDGMIIPWDDDIDVCMIRKNYDKFTDILKKEIKPPFAMADKRHGKFLRIVREDTMMYSSTCIYDGIKGGIFIDVFPLDNIPDDKDERKDYIDSILKYKGSYTPDEFDEIMRKYDEENTDELMDSAMISKNHIDDMVYEREWFNDMKVMNLSGLDVNVPIGYEKILEKKYGMDWMTPQMKKSFHGNQFYDTENSYKCYYKIPDYGNIILVDKFVEMIRNVNSVVYTGKLFKDSGNIIIPMSCHFNDINTWLSKLPEPYSKFLNVYYKGNNEYEYDIMNKNGDILKKSTKVQDKCLVEYDAINDALNLILSDFLEKGNIDTDN